MKLFSRPGTKRAPSLRGRYYVYETPGGTVVAAWPKKRPGAPTPDQAATMALFAEAVRAMKRMDADQQTYARANAAGTSYLPRDMLMACLFGRGPPIFVQNGEVFRSMATRINISTLLDNLTATPGSLLYRGGVFWLPVPPGNVGDYLRFTGPTLVPEWTAPTVAAETPRSAMPTATATTAGTGTSPSKALFFTPEIDVDIWGVSALVNGSAGHEHKPFVCETTGSGAGTKISVVAIGDQHPVTMTAAVRWRTWRFAAPVLIAAGQPFGAGISRVGAGDSATLPVVTPGSAFIYPPLPGAILGRLAIAKEAPAVDDVIGAPVLDAVGYTIGVDWLPH